MPAITLLCVFLLTLEVVAHDQADQPTVIDGIRFTLAEGLVIEKVADESLVKWPIVADWDDQGRLVVAESGGVSWPIAEHNQQQLHKIVRLVDRDGDGKFDQRIVAADQLAFPEGVLCLGKDMLVSAPPVIWKLTDDDGDGICEQREVWFDGTTLTNCANDLHGPYLGRDGWIYWCKGAFGTQTHPLLDGRTMESSAAHIYRRKIEGGPIEPLITGGMDNPVEVAFIPEGEKFFTSTFLQHPGGGLRDGIAHAVYGGVFGKEHAVLANHPRTGSLMPILTQLGPAAPSGLTCLHSDRLVSFAEHGKARVLVAALFNLQKLTAHQLLPQGASYQTLDHDLVVADRVDFHPTDVIEDADGSLLLIDTGGWYDLCCPTSRIDQKTASGGIYRISSAATAAVTIDRQPAAVQGASPELVATQWLHDPRPWVRRQAGLILARSSNAAIEPLDAQLRDVNRSIDERITALWALCQIGTVEAIAATSGQLRQQHPAILQAACHAVSIHRNADARRDLERLLEHTDLQVRRAAAEAIGRIASEASLGPLLDAFQRCGDDRHLEHSLLYAMIEISRGRSTNLMAMSNSDAKLRAALITLDRTDRSDEIELPRLFAALDSSDAKLAVDAAEILAKHSRWAASSVERLNDGFRKLESANSADAANLARLVAGWKHEQSIEHMIGDWIEFALAAGNAAQSLFVANHIAEFSPSPMPSRWTDSIATLMERSSEPVQRALAESLRRVVIQAEAIKLSQTLTRLARHAGSSELRLRLLSALPEGHQVGDAELEHAVITAFLSDDESLAPLASRALQRLKLSDPSRLVSLLAEVPSQSLTTAIEAVHRCRDDAQDKDMLGKLASIPAAKTLPQAYLTNLYKKSSSQLQDHAQRTTTELMRPPADVKATIDQTLARLVSGDPVRGLQVFRGNKAACSACHRVGYVGRDIGPELTRIGGTRTAEALLEAILFPSARQEQSYQGSRVLTVDGQVYNGLITRRTAEAIELQLNAERMIVVPLEQIESLQPSDVSVMPAGLADQLTIDELSDLMAFLRSAK